MTGNSTAVQCDILLKALQRRKRGITSIDITSKLHILRPSARVYDLRRNGHDVQTHWAWDYTPDGQPHRVARYVLMGEA